ncbi:hypothetical protein [Nannocystis bainbridge]|uniref:Tetratricopeptide repeat protein n=1 Tax=Nannocystis bainbridge TaxID=2995303 RepID=A0ABT5E3P8_9BACT|nr:hypothetical protein [Nannocystis bainbridge]MDC0720487.1 hypothetical protein [Nannocystis bainbridge]
MAPKDFDREIEVLVEQHKFEEAAVRLADELRRLPERRDTRGRRNDLAVRAANVYSEAFRAEPDDCGLAGAGLELADEYLQGLLAVYGAGAENSDEYVGMSGLREGLERASAQRGCAERETPAAAEPAIAIQARTDATKQPGERRLVVGLAISAGFTAALLAVSLGTGLSRYKAPFRGAAYNRIYDAAVASYEDADPGNDVAHGVDDDMCSEANGSMDGSDVSVACKRWEGLGTAAIVTGVMTGVLGATTIALAAVLAGKRRKSSGAAALLRRHGTSVGVAPAWRGGVNVSLGFAF